MEYGSWSIDWFFVSQAFEPKYKQLAAALAKTEPNLVLAKFDATANDAPEGFDVEGTVELSMDGLIEYSVEWRVTSPISGFPTIYFAPSGKKDKPIKVR